MLSPDWIHPLCRTVNKNPSRSAQEPPHLSVKMLGKETYLINPLPSRRKEEMERKKAPTVSLENKKQKSPLESKEEMKSPF